MEGLRKDAGFAACVRACYSLVLVGRCIGLLFRATMPDDIPLVGTKKPTVGDYVRTGSCLGEPRVRCVINMRSVRGMHVLAYLCIYCMKSQVRYMVVFNWF